MNQALIRGENGEGKVVREIGPGEFVGEIQLLTGQARTVDVKAAKETDLLFLPKISFDRLVSENQQILVNECAAITFFKFCLIILAH